MQWLDIEQNEHQKWWVDMEMWWRREAYKRREYERHQDELRMKRQEEERIRNAAKERAAAQASEAGRERKRKRTRRAEVAGPDAQRKGKYPRCTQ